MSKRANCRHHRWSATMRPPTEPALVKIVLRKILKLLLICFAVWLLAVIGLLAIFIIVQQPSPWLLPLARSWLATMSILWVGLLARQIWKWSNGKAVRPTLQWVGIAFIGLTFAGALMVIFTPTHILEPTKLAEPSSSTDIFSDHGPKRVACDSKWSALQHPDSGSYQEFLHNCMKDKSGSP
jgi:hypothetical protein